MPLVSDIRGGAFKNASYWGDLEDISQDDVLDRIVRRVAMNPVAYFEKIATSDYKQKLRTNTDELVERGGFGSPTMFIDGGDMYFGNDRLELVRAALRR